MCYQTLGSLIDMNLPLTFVHTDYTRNRLLIKNLDIGINQELINFYRKQHSVSQQVSKCLVCKDNFFL